MLLRHFEYLTALARERHFARAAQVCFVSQPALSAGIRKLEAEFGVLIVQRGNRFLGFTPEGERIVRWAERLLAERDALVQDVSASGPELAGRLRIGAIPTTLSSLPLLTVPFRQAHPRAHAMITSLTSIEIQRQLLHYDCDVGVTYIDNEPITGGLVAQPLYRERYVLVTAGDAVERGEATWQEAAELPLCLLSPDMQNRRILNAAFHRAEVEPHPAIETNSVSALCAHVRDGGWASVMPHAWFHLFALPAGLRALRLVGPEIAPTIGLVTREAAPEPALVRAFRELAETVDLQRSLDHLLERVFGQGAAGPAETPSGEHHGEVTGP
ncbi:LysR family transcriptional regulator [Lipingzhangella sp. LS1_29]|uniref:LysR family transcriptional regulator n=1 Tax=Lipingzhangella rawalii TaxID=2055835 RepID=A0ABU2H6E4_9ACTN|nr:LysR family transcriptional regulator [Lipingzhangella rawalii]MDS1270877.1 LysR family transcriptional regulator [Lipingzhangella rawalii]